MRMWSIFIYDSIIPPFYNLLALPYEPADRVAGDHFQWQFQCFRDICKETGISFLIAAFSSGPVILVSATHGKSQQCLTAAIITRPIWTCPFGIAGSVSVYHYAFLIHTKNTMALPFFLFMSIKTFSRAHGPSRSAPNCCFILREVTGNVQIAAWLRRWEEGLTVGYVCIECENLRHLHLALNETPIYKQTNLLRALQIYCLIVHVMLRADITNTLRTNAAWGTHSKAVTQDFEDIYCLTFAVASSHNDVVA